MAAGNDPDPAGVPGAAVREELPPHWAPPRKPEPKVAKWTGGALIVTFVFAVISMSVQLVSLPYDSIGPGDAHDVGDVVKVKGAPTYPASGRILYATVSVHDGITPLQALIGWLDPDTEVVHRTIIRGSTPPAEYHQQNVDAMADSKNVAQVLALRHLGYPEADAGAEVLSIDSALPAAKVLKPHDVIIGVDGRPITTSAQAVEGIRAHQPGERIRLRIQRGDETLDVESDLARGPEGVAQLGVRLSTKAHLPFEVEIDSGGVVGPSAGLAYALELLDILTPGELTGGAAVAATGELDDDGHVFPIGGVAHKVVTAREAGVKMFLVPRLNFPEAQAEAGNSLDVRAVDTFDDAVRALGSLEGSNALALGKPGAVPPA